jgi:hypothetical protein
MVSCRKATKPNAGGFLDLSVTLDPERAMITAKIMIMVAIFMSL